MAMNYPVIILQSGKIYFFVVTAYHKYWEGKRSFN